MPSIAITRIHQADCSSCEASPFLKFANRDKPSENAHGRKKYPCSCSSSSYPYPQPHLRGTIQLISPGRRGSCSRARESLRDEELHLILSGRTEEHGVQWSFVQPPVHDFDPFHHTESHCVIDSAATSSINYIHNFINPSALSTARTASACTQIRPNATAYATRRRRLF